jgi:hypothetical protein
MNKLSLSIPMIKSMIPETFSLFFLGCGTAYIMEEKKYTHIPVFILFPEAYCGYNMYKNRDKIIKYILKPT